MSTKINNKIDFVITWVDGNDPEWIAEKAKWDSKINNSALIDNSMQRYRDMGTLKYWFRGVDKYAKYVNKVYFVTYGHLPKWLNINNEKIEVIKHSDFIPKDKLPTFNSNAIEEYLHLIPGLAENFVYFNDDMFIINKTSPEDFFTNGTPRDCMSLSPLLIRGDDNFHRKVLNDLEIINKHFVFNECYRKNKKKYLSLKQGRYLFRTLSLSNYSVFPGFQYYHIPVSYNKTTFRKVWAKEKETLEKTSSFRFRNNYESVNHWLFEYWQFAEGNFLPRKSSFGKCITIADDRADRIINGKKHKVVCINDSSNVVDFNGRKNEIISFFEKKFPEKSSYEK